MLQKFLDKLTAKWKEGKFVCVGLDSDLSKIPQNLTQFEFNKLIIDQTADLVCAYKFQSAFYEAEGVDGLKALKDSINYLAKNYPDIPTILDAKRGDIGNTNEAYAKAIFDNLGFDALTVHPYLGGESLQPFLDRIDKGIIVLVKTSNPGASELQDLNVGSSQLPLYQVVAQKVANDWNKNGNCAVVVGATYPKELKKVREIIGDMPILIPGVGTQGGDVRQTVQAGLNSKREGIIISSSRAIIFADNPRAATLKLHEEIIQSLKLSF